MAEESKTNIICISYDDLVNVGSDKISTTKTKHINNLIEKAFSSVGLGIIAITDVPNLSELRLKLLPLAQKLATLPHDQLEEITISPYQVGWSHGREKLEGNKPDYSKGSFYANPLTEDLTESMLDRRKYQQRREAKDNMSNNIIDEEMEETLQWDESLNDVDDDTLRALAKSCPAFFAPNIWPTKHLPELESAFNDVGQLVHNVGIMVAKCCDVYVSSMCPGYEENKLEKIVRHSKCCKARLLHYFPTNTADDDGETTGESSFSNWCGWHNDHGSLTGLLPALYVDGNGNIVDCPDEKAGLYIKSRNGELVHANFPANALAFQVGETSQILTGGLLQATPHAVRGCKGGGNISRETFAIFMEPEYHSKMDLPDGRNLADTQCIAAEQHLPTTCRTLRSRWKMGQNFGQFSDATFAAFH